MAAQSEQGYTLGKTALRQLEQVVRRVLPTYVNAAMQSRPRPVPNELIEFVLGETLDAASDPLTLAQCQYARAYVYGRDVDGNAVYIRQQYIWNMYTGVTGDFAQYGTAAFINGRWIAQTIDCDPIQDYTEPEALDEFLPDKPQV